MGWKGHARHTSWYNTHITSYDTSANIIRYLNQYRPLRVYLAQRKFVLYMSACTDGTGFFNRGNQSWGPYTGVCFNLPPWLRNKFACLFMFGVMPNKIKNYNRTCMTHTCSDTTRTHPHPKFMMTFAGLVRAILASCKDFLWETEPRGPGLRVFNSFTNEWVTIWLVIIRLIEDSMGLPKCLCCHQQPAYIGEPYIDSSPSYYLLTPASS